ncbi:MAG: hypothetical protein HFJ52_02805 [Clostridia bacterium]|nr:hypothetical protein [Clostridia bacterium]
MVKSVIKEVIIILLLLLAVILALGVLFYEYIPTNKTVPNVSTYKTSDSVQRELEEKVADNETIIETYEVTAEDLKKAQKTNTYVPGKANPFSTYEEPEENTTNPDGTTSNTVGTNVNTSKGGTSTQNTFYKNTGTK